MIAPSDSRTIAFARPYRAQMRWIMVVVEHLDRDAVEIGDRRHRRSLTGPRRKALAGLPK
jgi:hypothetical protein